MAENEIFLYLAVIVFTTTCDTLYQHCDCSIDQHGGAGRGKEKVAGNGTYKLRGRRFEGKMECEGEDSSSTATVFLHLQVEDADYYADQPDTHLDFM